MNYLCCMKHEMINILSTFFGTLFAVFILLFFLNNKGKTRNTLIIRINCKTQSLLFPCYRIVISLLFSLLYHCYFLVIPLVIFGTFLCFSNSS